jgi:hypothetical protein
MFKRVPVDLPFDSEDVRTFMFLLADIRTELVAIHVLLMDEDDGEEADQNS